MKIDNQLVWEALERFARTDDGRVFYIGLQKILMSVPTSLEAGALQENLGRRKFAAELMAVMAKGLGEADSDDANRRPIIFELSHPVSVSGGHGARRRVSPDPGDPSNSGNSGNPGDTPR